MSANQNGQFETEPTPPYTSQSVEESKREVERNKEFAAAWVANGEALTKEKNRMCNSKTATEDERNELVVRDAQHYKSGKDFCVRLGGVSFSDEVAEKAERGKITTKMTKYHKTEIEENFQLLGLE